jgi:hypothetical protein
VRGSEHILKEDQHQDDLYNDAVTEYGASIGRLAGAYEADPDKRRDLIQEIHFLHRGMWTTTTEEVAISNNGVKFYRQLLKRRLSLFNRVLRWSFGPLVLSICTLIVVLTGIAKNVGQSVTLVIPLCIAFAGWIVAFFVLRSKGHKQLRSEIDELDHV